MLSVIARIPLRGKCREPIAHDTYPVPRWNVGKRGIRVLGTGDADYAETGSSLLVPTS